MSGARDDSRICPKCGASNAAGLEFCRACGVSLSQVTAAPVRAERAAQGLKRCRECGRDNEARFKFCLSCGAALVDGPAPAEDELSARFFEAEERRPATPRSGSSATLIIALLAALAAALAWLVLR